MSKHDAAGLRAASLPRRNGVAASSVQLPAGDGISVLDALCARFPRVDRAQWLGRMQRGLVFDASGAPLAQDQPSHAEMRVFYYREVGDEPRLPVQEQILHLDAHLLVADKPHFLPVTPSGGYVEETLLARLARRYPGLTLVPIHRIDRGTAGLVLFSTNPASCAAYQALFRERRIEKFYEAFAPPLPGQTWPLSYRSRLVAGDPFVRMCELDGIPNSETRIDVIARSPGRWLYALQPLSGRKHQLRVHMAALGAPIENDDFYPRMLPASAPDYARPLQLLARRLVFVDPLDATPRCYESALRLT